jgi:microcystin degradation protein MlrC
MKRFVIAVFSHETNTFSSIPTPLKSFGLFTGGNGPVLGDEALKAYQGTNTPVAAFIDFAKTTNAELVFAIAAQATPSGPADDLVLQYAAESICKAVSQGCDAVLLDLHGGMVTKGYDDPEGELIRRIRDVAQDLPICVVFDFHTNLSQMTVDNATIITGYRTYPHIDTYEAGQRACHTLSKTLRGEVDPIILWHSLPLLTHLNCQTPSRQPMKDIMDSAITAEANGEVLNASVFGGWPLADIPHVGLHGVVVADRSKVDVAEVLLKRLMSKAWDRRDDFFFAIEPVKESILRAKKINEGPIVLADHGDVAGSGGSTDVPVVLSEVLRQGLEDVCAGPIWDPETVDQMISAGVGSEVTVQLGGKTNFPAINFVGKALKLTGIVRCITDGRFIVTGPQNTGIFENLGLTAVLDIGNSVIVVCSLRHEPYDPGVFTHAGIDPSQKKFILIKSRQHFRSGFGSIFKEVVMVSGPGICTSDYSQFPWKNVRRPIYPFDTDIELEFSF